RFPGDVPEEVGPAGVDHPPLDLVGQPGVVVVPGGKPADLTGHLPQQLAVVAGLRQRQVIGGIGDDLAQSPHEPGPLTARHGSPLALERRTGGTHRVRHVLPGGLGHLGPRLARVGVDRRERGRAGTLLRAHRHRQTFHGLSPSPYWDGPRSPYRAASPSEPLARRVTSAPTRRNRAARSSSWRARSSWKALTPATAPIPASVSIALSTAA